MKFLGLVVLLGYVSFCSAAANRSTIWLLGDEVIYTINGYQKCSQVAASTNKSLITTKYFSITSGSTADALYYKTFPGDPATAATVGNTYYLPSMQLSFSYGDNVTPNLVFNLNAFTALGSATTGSFSFFITNVIAPGTYLNAYGTPWITVRAVSTTGYPNAAAATGSSLASASVLITDYRSQSTILVTQYQDGNDGTATQKYNHMYSVVIRTFTSYLTTTTDLLVGGCTARSVTITQATSSLTCSTYLSSASAYDSSFSGSTICTDSGVPDAISLSITAVSNLRIADNAVFGAAGTKFTIAASFGFFIAMSSIFFNL